MDLKIDLERNVIGFNNKPLMFQANDKEYRNMTVRDALQMSIATMSTRQEFKTLALIHKLIPCLNNENKELIISSLEEKEMIAEAIRNTETLNVLAKSFLIVEILKK